MGWVLSKAYTTCERGNGLGVIKSVHNPLSFIFPAVPTARHPVQTPGTNPRSNRFRCYRSGAGGSEAHQWADVI